MANEAPKVHKYLVRTTADLDGLEKLCREKRMQPVQIMSVPCIVVCVELPPEEKDEVPPSKEEEQFAAPVIEGVSAEELEEELSPGDSL